MNKPITKEKARSIADEHLKDISEFYRSTNGYIAKGKTKDGIDRKIVISLEGNVKHKLV